MLTLSLDLPFLCELQENKITRNLFSQIQSEMSVRPARKKTLNKAAMICCFLSSLKRNFSKYYWLIQKKTFSYWLFFTYDNYEVYHWPSQILCGYLLATANQGINSSLLLVCFCTAGRENISYYLWQHWPCCVNIVASWNLTKLPSCWTMLWFRV